MFAGHKRKHILKVLVLSNVGKIIRPVHGETSSILNGATITMSTGNLTNPVPSAKEHLIDNSYKALVHSDAGKGPYGDSSFWFTIDLKSSKSLKTAFVVNLTSCCPARMGSSYICIGNDSNGPKA